MIEDIARKIADKLSPEEQAEFANWFERNRSPVSGTGYPNVSDNYSSLGRMIAGEFIAPASGSEADIPTDIGFTGAAMGGNGWEFLDDVFNFVAVANGVLQAGFNTAGKLYAAVGAWVADMYGITVNGLGFAETHYADVGGVERRMRRGFQEKSSKPNYVIERFDDSAGTNLITVNAGIETGSLATGFSSATNWSASSDYANGGTYSAKIDGSLTDALVTNKYATTAGAQYKFKVYTRGVVRIIVEAKWYTSAPTLVRTDIIGRSSSTNAFLPIMATLQAPAASTQVEMRVYISTTGGGYLYVDDFEIIAVASYDAIEFSDDGIHLTDGGQTVSVIDGGVDLPLLSTMPDPASNRGALAVSEYDHPVFVRSTGVSHPILPFHRAFAKIETDCWGTGNGVAPFTLAAISSGTVAVASAESHPGFLEFSSSSFANTGYAIYLGSATTITPASDDIFECVFLPEAAANIVLRLGFMDSFNTTAPTDGAYLYASGTTLDGRTYQSGSTSTTSTSYTISPGVWYYGRVIYGGATLVTFELYSTTGTLLWTNTLATNVPLNEYTPAAVAYKTNSGSSYLAAVDWIAYNNPSIAR